MESQQSNVQLRRALSLPLITFYGLGTILGAGIYVLVGEVVVTAGIFAPVAFLLAAVAAAFSAFSYAELAARHPLAGAEAVYVQEGFGRRGLSMFVGLLICFSGIVSSATLTRGFVGYLSVFFDVPENLVIIVLLLALGLLALWGILESAAAAAVATIIEVGGLVLIIVVCWDSFATLPHRWPELVPPWEGEAWWGIALGAFLAFYAFIGFEDMANVAEEVKDPERNMPRAIILALVGSSVLYMLIVIAAVSTLPIAALSDTDAPLALLYETATGSSPTIIAIIGLFAVINGALIQIIRSSRMLYAMSRAGWLPRQWARLNERTQTPIFATILIAVGVMVFAIWLPLVALAQLTSFSILVVFGLVNLSLIRIKKH